MRPAIAFQDPESHENYMHCIRAQPVRKPGPSIGNIEKLSLVRCLAKVFNVNPVITLAHYHLSP